MKKSYKISRVILAVITLIIFNIIFINEDKSSRFIPFIFAAIVYGFSYPSAVVSRKLINFGNKIENKMLKIFYYVLFLPFILLFIFGAISIIMFLINENIPTSNEIGTAIGQAFMFLFFITIVFIAVILPYVQTVIVLILNHFFIKSHKKNQSFD